MGRSRAGSFKLRYETKSALLWLVLVAVAAFSPVFDIHNEAWFVHLFSEYDPPRALYSRFLESRPAAGMDMQNTTLNLHIWDPPAYNGWKPCLQEEEKTSLVTSLDRSRYFQVLCGGGLFQLHICVCNAVAVARLLNATLVIPYFKLHPFWNDPSQFEDIYDVDHFISSLRGQVKVVQELPAMFSWSTPQYYWNRCLERPNCLTFLPKHTTPSWFFTNVVPILERHSVAAVDGFEHKLTFEGLPPHVTKLRCKANFHSLRFVQPIRELGNTLTARMRRPRSKLEKLSSLQPLEGNVTVGHYIGLHVRFERDMIAYSSCEYGGGRAEQNALSSFRYRMWSNRVARAQQKPEDLRRNGSCPMTPEEMGLLLAAFEFPIQTPVYIAGKELYGGPARMKPLKKLFPGIQTKYSLATKQELSSLIQFSHRLTALDFTVLFNSDVFMSNAAGNFPNVLTGHRSFFGPRLSVHPDKAHLSKLLSNRSLDWAGFVKSAVAAHQTRLGSIERRRFRYSVYRYPSPDCMCYG